MMMMDYDETWRSRDETWRRSRDMMDYQGATERHPRRRAYRGEATPTTSWVLGGFHRGHPAESMAAHMKPIPHLCPPKHPCTCAMTPGSPPGQPCIPRCDPHINCSTTRAHQFKTMSTQGLQMYSGHQYIRTEDINTLIHKEMHAGHEYIRTSTVEGITCRAESINSCIA